MGDALGAGPRGPNPAGFPAPIDSSSGAGADGAEPPSSSSADAATADWDSKPYGGEHKSLDAAEALRESERGLPSEGESPAGLLADMDVPRPPIAPGSVSDTDHREAEDTALAEPEVGRRPSSESQGVLAALLRAWQRTEAPTAPLPATESTVRPEATLVARDAAPFDSAGFDSAGFDTVGADACDPDADDAGDADSIVMEEIPVPQWRQGSGVASVATDLGGERTAEESSDDQAELEPARGGGAATFTPLSVVSTDQLGPEALQKLQSAGIHSLEQLVGMEAQELVNISGLRYTQVLRLQFLARRTLRD